MKTEEVTTFGGLTVFWLLVTLITFAVLQWIGIPAGNFLDWLVGAVSFWWLMVITTIPWNVHFKAKQVLAEAQESQEKGIAVDGEQVRYVSLIVRRSLTVAIALHGLSALTLYVLAIAGVSRIGYISSVAALLLTGLRPAIAFYQYLASRLQTIGQEVKYPREDLFSLRDRVRTLEQTVQTLSAQVNPEQPDSLIAAQRRQLESLRQDLTGLMSSHHSLEAQNTSEHERLAREAQGAIAKVNADAEFLDRARELIRFFKDA
ncbi:hypothetical protein E1H12_02860 [Geitlerinema sp. P-1104]|uniref:hypothetical protein n=1 Tax=Geitlerinema sp. P-1104 TaxID=2546230 RepID=UPI001476D701|nr:hypothetical protein [Geitlerinema sp. P-1104]NMG57487.1 hypothetical protein [Geitlerinema sp. P-1104]